MELGGRSHLEIFSQMDDVVIDHDITLPVAKRVGRIGRDETTAGDKSSRGSVGPFFVRDNIGEKHVWIDEYSDDNTDPGAEKSAEKEGLEHARLAEKVSRKCDIRLPGLAGVGQLCRAPSRSAAASPRPDDRRAPGVAAGMSVGEPTTLASGRGALTPVPSASRSA